MCYKQYKPYTKDYKIWTTLESVTTVVMSSSHSILNIRQLDRHLHLWYLQLNGQYLHGRGVSYIRIGEGVSLPP
jgi:hypothetical protein